MAERIVFWRAVADFSKVRKEAAKTQASLEGLREEVRKNNAESRALGNTEDRMGAKVSNAEKKVATARQESTRATDLGTSASRKSNAAHDAEARTLERLRYKVAQLAAANRAAENATRYGTPAFNEGPDNLSAVQAAIAAKKRLGDVTNQQARADAALQRATASVTSAQDNNTRVIGRLNAAEERRAVSLANLNSAAIRVRSSELSLADAIENHGKESEQAIHADVERTRALAGQQRALRDVRSAEMEVSRVRQAGMTASDDLGRAEQRLRIATENAAREFKVGSGGGNIFTRALRGVESGFNKADSAAGRLAHGLINLRWPIIAGGAYILVEALSTLVGGLFSLASAVGPAFGALAAGLPTIFALAGAFGTLRAAFSGVGGTLQAYTQAQLKGPQQASQAANTQANNQDAIQSAHRSLGDARSNVGVVQKQAAQQIAAAGRTIITSDQAQTQAEKDLSQARKDAIANIAALKTAVVDAALAERGATLDLADARDNLKKVLDDPTASRADRERARLQLDQAKQAQKEAKKGHEDAKKQARDAATAGVKGDAGVISARQQLAQATYDANKAQRDYNNAVTEGARQEQKAREAVTQAVQALDKAQRNAAAGANSAGSANDNYRARLAALTPAARKFVLQLISMKHYWTDLKNTAANNLFPGLTLALNRLPKLFPVINRGVGIIARALGHIGNSFSKMITTPRWIRSFQTLFKASSPILRALGKTAMNLLDALRAVTVAAVPLTKRLMEAVVAWSKHLDQLATAPGAYERMVAWFSKAYDRLSELSDIFKNIITGFFNMGKAAQNSGKSILDSIDRITKKWAAWTGSTKGQNVLAKYFDDVRKNMRLVDHLIGALGLGFLHMGANKNFKPIVNGFKAIWTAIKNAFGGNGQAITDAFVSLLKGIAIAIQGIAANSDGLHTFLSILAGAVHLFDRILQLPGVAPIVGAIFTAFAAFKALKLIGAISGINGLATAIAKFVKKSAGVEAAAAGTAAAMSEVQAANTAAPGVIAAPLARRGVDRRVANEAAGARTFAVSRAGEATQVAGAGAVAAGGSGSKIIAGASKVKSALMGTFITGEASIGTKGGVWGIVIAAIAAALTFLYFKWKWFHDAVNKIFHAIGEAALYVWNKLLKPFVMGIANFVKTHSDGFKQLFNALGNLWKTLAKIFQDLMPVFKFVLSALGVAFKVLWAVAQPILKALGIAIGIAAKLIQVAIEAIIAVFNFVAKIIAHVINDVLIPVIKGVAWAVRGIWRVLKVIWDAIVAVFRVAVKVIWNVIKTWFKIIAAVALAPIRGLIALFQWIWSKIGGVVKTAMNNIWNFLKNLWGTIRDTASTVWHAIVGVIAKPLSTLWDGIKSGWNAIWGFLKTAWNTVKNVAKTIWENIAGAISGAFGGVGTSIADIWDTVERIFASAVNFVTQDIINPLIRAINWVITKFGIDAISQIPKIDVTSAQSPPSGGQGHKKSAAATGGVVPHDIGNTVPGYTPGRDPHEFVSNTGYRVHLSGGEGILTPETTRAIGGSRGVDQLNAHFTKRLHGQRFDSARNGMEAHAEGGVVGSPSQQHGYEKWAIWRLFRHEDRGTLGDIVHTFSDVVQLVRKGLGAVVKGGFNALEAPIRGLTDHIPGNIPWLPEMVNGFFDKVNTAIYSFISGNDKNSKFNPQNDLKLHGQINGSQARGDVMVSGLALNNMTDVDGILDSSYAARQIVKNARLVDALDTIISYESNWNADAINNVDINAKEGHPSQGLMQTIPTTYSAYVNPNLDRGITDAVSNVSAGIGYANSRYGGLNNVPGVEAVRSGGKYVGYDRGGVIQLLHKGGVVKSLNKKSNNRGIAAIKAQAGLGFDAKGPSAWDGALTELYKHRLAGTSKSQGIQHPALDPHAQATLSPDSNTTKQLLNWVDEHDPKTYAGLWTNQPVKGGGHNAHHRNPLLPILSYLGGEKAWSKFRDRKDNAKWDHVLKSDRKAYDRAKKAKKPNKDQQALLKAVKDNPRYFTKSAAEKRHPGVANQLHKKDRQWHDDLAVIRGAAGTEKGNVAYLRHTDLKMGGRGGNDGLWSSDMTNPLDHAAAHAIGKEHPADWEHPWSGPVTAAEKALADSDRANALYKEWYADLQTIADWGYANLVDWLINKGITDGMETARSAVKDKKTAKQLNESLKLGNGTGDDTKQQQIMQIIAKLASGKPGHPFGLRDISSYMNMQDVTVVDLFKDMAKQLKALPNALTKKFEGDVDLFRKGLFYASTGGMVPGDQGSPNVDSQPAMLVPGEGVLNRKAMELIGGEKNLNALNMGVKPQGFANGGVMLSPTFANTSVGQFTLNENRARTLRAGSPKTAAAAPVVNNNVNINNPTGENSVYSMSKALQRHTIMGTFDKMVS